MSIIEKYNQSHAERKRREVEERAAELYQLTEHGGELWLTFSGSLVCPCQMLKDGPVEAVKKMRELYIRRHETKQ